MVTYHSHTCSLFSVVEVAMRPNYCQVIGYPWHICTIPRYLLLMSSCIAFNCTECQVFFLGELGLSGCVRWHCLVLLLAMA